MRRSLSFLILLAASLSPKAPAQALYSCTEQAWPGSDVHVEGDSIDSRARFTVYPYSPSGVRGAGLPAAISVTTGQVAMVRLPSAMANAVYEIAASTPKGPTNSLFMNRPRLQWLDRDKAQPGQTVRVIGRNLWPVPGKTPTVTLTSASSAATVCARTTTDDKYIEFTVPSGLAPGAYSLDVQNGLTTGSVSKSPSSLPLRVVGRSADPFGTGKWWAGETVPLAANVFNIQSDPRLTYHADGTGSGNDATAFGYGLAKVVQTGGTLYLPAGHYRISQPDTTMLFQGCVIKGDGSGKTFIDVNDEWTPSHPATGQFCVRIPGGNAPGQIGRARGIVGVTIVDHSTSTGSARTGVLNTFGGEVDHLFLKDVAFENGSNALEIQVPNLADSIVDRCAFHSASDVAGALLMTNARLTSFTNNSVSYRVGRCTIDFGSRVAILHDRIFFDNAYRHAGSPETGGLQPSVTAQCLVADNDIGATGPIGDKVDGDGELIVWQLNVAEDFSRVGAIKGSTVGLARPLDAWPSAAWTLTAQSDLPRSYVSIVRGKGAGQWRLAKAWTNGAVQPDRPWQVAPDATSRYVVTSSSAYQQTVVGNRLSGSVTGISLYDGGYDCAISGNDLHNAGGILVRADAVAVYRKDLAWEARGSNYQIIAAWAVTIDRNRVANDDGVRPAWIALTTQDEGYNGEPDDLDPPSSNPSLSKIHTRRLASAYRQYGMLMLGIDVVDNEVVGRGTAANPAIQSYFPDGLTISNDVHTPTDFRQALGIVFEGNSLTGCLTSPLNTTGSDHPAPLVSALGNRALAYPAQPTAAATH